MRAAKSCSDGTEHDPIERRLVLRLLASTEARQRYRSRFAEDSPIAELLGQAPRGARRKDDEWGTWLDRLLEAEERRPLARSGPLFRNIRLLSRLIPLSAIEQEVLAFWSLYSTREAISDLLDTCFINLTEQRLARLIAIAWRRERTAVESAVRCDARLFASGFLRLEPHQHLLSFKVQALPGLLDALFRKHNSAEQVVGFAVNRAPESILGREDYPHLADEIGLLTRYLAAASKARTPGVNVLIHGPPGVGKTEFVRFLAKELGMRLYEVGAANREGSALKPRQRFDAYVFNQRLFAAQAQTVMLFDEIEDVFPDPHGTLEASKGSGCDKAWINRLLETNAVPTFWVANRIGHLHPAYLRRFDYVLEMRNPPCSVRSRILCQHLKGLPLSVPNLARYADDSRITPALSAKAARIIKTARPTDAGALERQLEQVIENHLAALGASSKGRYRLADDYSLEYLNATVDLNGLTEALKRLGRGRVLLHGPPGTGKTGYAHHIARAIDRPLMEYRASDLQSMWLGETEKNLARMFREAAAEGAVLLLDEAESFLQERRQAVRAWEVSQVNELLAQTECYQGVLVCATNLMERLDAAALRRFVWKVRFDYPTREQRRRLFDTLVTTVGEGEMDDLARARAYRVLDSLSNLTPGDYAVVRAQAQARGTKMSVAKLLEALEEESRAKPDGQKRTIGFAG